MDTVKHKTEWACMVGSRRSQVRRPRTRALLLAVAVAMAAGIPVASGFRNVKHALSTVVCGETLSGAAPANSTSVAPVNNTNDFDWQSLTPSTDINWAPCYDGHQCARLLLPLDYLSVNSSSSDAPSATTAIALRMIPARDRANYRGSVLVNPGGPGGAGTGDFMTLFGQNLSAVVGDSFDVLAFDPRGVGASTPALECFASNAARDIWNTQEGRQLLNASDDALLDFYVGRARVVGDRCKGISAEMEGGDIARFMGTASVATDMVKIVEKLGQDKVQFWGFSYGTVLGQYFAAMYPDKVGRVILDGVFDGYNYRSGLWNSNLLDNEAVIDSLFTFCHQAGPLKCPLYESIPSAIRDRFHGVLDAVKRSPIPVPLAEPPLVVTYKALANQILNGAYTPLALYPILAATIHAIETANQTTLALLAPTIVSPVVCDCQAQGASPPDNEYEAESAIACGDVDTDPPPTFDRAAFRTFFADLVRGAPTSGPSWATLHLGCTQWPVRAAWRYTGALSTANRTTANPILIVQPKFDPVCPLRDALAVRGRYAGAGLLVQDSYGHASLAAPSVCTARAVRAYLEEGTMPEEGTVCEPDELPFVGQVSGGEGAVQARTEEDERLLDALRGLEGAVRMFGAGRFKL